jgi:hypothetical protein
MSSEILRAKLLNLLLTDAVRKIDFVFGSFHVDFGGFMSVWSMVATGGIDVDVQPLSEKDAAGGYNYPTNKFLFPDEGFGTTPDQQSVLVHESVHAMRDVRYHGGSEPRATWAEDEATAYVAGALFKLYTFPQARRSTYPLFAQAYEIAGAVKDKPSAVVSDNDAKAMIAIIATEPDYVKKGMTFWKRSFADGI